MKKQEINMIGGGFQHAIASSDGYEPIYVKWIKGNHTAPISIHIDYSIKDIPSPHTKNYGWLSESKTINADLYEWAAPIYYGIKNIGEFFNPDGIIVLDDTFDIETLSFELYYSKLKAVEENYNISKNILLSEDYIYLNYIK
jgi:hypothetical protein